MSGATWIFVVHPGARCNGGEIALDDEETGLVRSREGEDCAGAPWLV